MIMNNIVNFDKIQELKRKGYERVDQNYKLDNKFKGRAMDYQLKRMKLQNTGDILKAIDTYMLKHYKRHIENC
ncbi:hypothetical protein [Brassicibacter mesophilus]|uniref:hypothetical protein n=1 Tax=Brassicibacter mesophilus TaxID=745119 RepID=UPI003D1E1798